MLISTLTVLVHALALAALFVVLLWALPRAMFGLEPYVSRFLARLERALTADEHDGHDDAAPKMWPRISGPA